MANKDLTIILVHGAWGDGSHWRHVIPALTKAGYRVRAVQNPLTSLQDDVNRTLDLIDAQDGNVLLVGHSYGGAVITNAGNHEKVVGLVYIAAFAPDEGENVGGIFARRQPPLGAGSIYPDAKGLLWIKYDEFHKSFCEDLDAEEALVMSLAQKPISPKIFSDQTTEPAWKTKPSWYQVSDRDNMIPPETQKEMAAHINAKGIIHLDTGHASMASHPVEITALILEAAQSV
ncbi:pimeloyl-ACP methyl ester carboxylesterase [Pedobacter cryoconitis]|uniref:Pimeloyl-ACP methyl ester carboxylesterase n=1 Tax=Pedobacter cryoconitis TaxID=188932 RepID=A0A7W8ZQ56_9SPHI|nr:alpha/beta hydrolase [Pedobacter cryoconitis]MBB5638126.1 pimeloyl-ACP methyl ester carboxylesterase [Pedobacter cryoconitis]